MWWELPEHSLCSPFLPKQGAVLHLSNNCEQPKVLLCMAGIQGIALLQQDVP